MVDIKRIYDELSKIETLCGKLEINESQGCIRIGFHEYLRLTLTAGRYEITIVMNENLTHWHCDEEDVLLDIAEIAAGDVVFLEHMNTVYRFFLNPVRILDKAAFEKKKERYLSRKKLRIYTGNRIIKQGS